MLPSCCSRSQRARAVRRGLALRISSDEPATLSLLATVSGRQARRLGLRSAARRVTIARGRIELTSPATRTLRLALRAPARRALAHLGAVRLRVLVRAAGVDRAGNVSSASRSLTVAR